MKHKVKKKTALRHGIIGLSVMKNLILLGLTDLAHEEEKGQGGNNNRNNGAII